MNDLYITSIQRVLPDSPMTAQATMDAVEA